MKTITVLLAIAAVVLAEPEKEAPYPPSGWKPDGPQFTYPPPTNPPSNEYGPASPSNEYGPASPSNEYGPATTPAPTEQPTQPPATYVPSDQSTAAPTNGGYARYQNQRFSSRPSAQFNQAAGQFFIITPQGQLQHIPIAVPQPNNRDVETVEPAAADDARSEQANRLVQPSFRQGNQQKSGQAANQLAQFSSITPDGRLERVRQARPSSGSDAAQPQFVAFIPAVPLRQVEATSAMVQQQPENGQYHVIYPNGKLQRVQYMNMLGPDNRLTANVQYQEVDPLRGPLYTFGSPLVRVL